MEDRSTGPSPGMTSKLTRQDIERSLTTKTLGQAVEVYPIALTTESLALGWLRQHQAPHGALVVADKEISARTRSGGGIENDGGLSFSLILRPALAIDYQDILWAVALLGACAGYEQIGVEARAWWPESLVAEDEVVGHVRVETQLAPGAIDSSVLTFRLGLPEGAEQRIETLDGILRSLEDLFATQPTEIANLYLDRCALKGRPIRIGLRPNGASGGTAESIDERGGFGVTASSGSVTRYGVDQIREVRLR